MPELRFSDSLWINTDIALHQVNDIYQQEMEPLGLTVLESYILRALYEQDGQMASQLASAVGRMATSFTPVLDRLQKNDLIERQLHPADRRAVKVFLTEKGRALEEQVKASFERIESRLRKQFKDKDWQSYERVVVALQTIAS